MIMRQHFLDSEQPVEKSFSANICLFNILGQISITMLLTVVHVGLIS